MTTIQHILQTAKMNLSETSEEPRLDAEILLAFTLNQPRTFLFTAPHYELSQEEEKRYKDYLNRRTHQEPVAYITGRKEFWSLEFKVTKDTLIPRPESELLVETVINLLVKDNEPKKLADLGTGSGAIALALAFEKSAWQIYATDISEAALKVAKFNANCLDLKNVTFAQGDWFTALCTADFDAIISNPPYISEKEWLEYGPKLKFEPKNALLSGQDGLNALKTLAKGSKYHLKSGGYLFLEHGFQQGASVREILKNQGYEAVQTLCDLSRQERVTIGRIAENDYFLV